MLVRFMIVAAEKKRLVEYSEINKVFGIPLEDIRDYAGFRARKKINCTFSH
jgi:hypothetical protein